MDEHSMSQNKEIDLVYIYRAFGKFITNIGLFLYDFLIFLKRNTIIIVAILVLGASLGYYLDSRQKKLLKHDFIVVLNFGSVDFLYETFYKDSSNLKKEGWLNVKEVKKVKIKPIENVYTLLKNNKQILEFYKVISEKGSDITTMTNKSIRKNHKYHLLSIYTTTETRNTREIIQDFFYQLNTQDYYLKKQAIAQVQNQVKKRETIRSLQQMNSLLDNLGAPDNDSKGVSIKNLPEIQNLFYRKNNIMDDLVMLEEEILEQQKTVYITKSSMNNIDDENSWNKKIIYLPLVLLLLFFSAIGLRNFIRKYRLIKENRLN